MAGQLSDGLSCHAVKPTQFGRVIVKAMTNGMTDPRKNIQYTGLQTRTALPIRPSRGPRPNIKRAASHGNTRATSCHPRRTHNKQRLRPLIPECDDHTHGMYMRGGQPVSLLAKFRSARRVSCVSLRSIISHSWRPCQPFVRYIQSPQHK